jgi:hypothetical protein
MCELEAKLVLKPGRDNEVIEECSVFISGQSSGKVINL